MSKLIPKKVKEKQNKEQVKPPENCISITQAARMNGVTRQAVYVAIKQGKLKAYKANNSRCAIALEDLEEYKRNKYSRSRSMFNGELLYDKKKGNYSVNETAKLLNVPAQNIYYAARIGRIKAVQKKKSSWVIHIDDINEYKENYLDNKKLGKMEA